MEIDYSPLNTMSDLELLAVVHSPDYVDMYRNAARQLLVERGCDSEFITTWRDPIAHTPQVTWTVSSTVADLERLWSRRAVFYRVTWWALIIVWIVIGAVSEVLGERDDLLAIAVQVLTTMLFYGWIVVVIVQSLRWRHPVRFLLLRPFMNKKASKALRGFVKHNTRFFGHTYTLSDKYLSNEPRFAAWRGAYFYPFYNIWLWWIFSKEITVARDIPKLSRTILRREVRNFEWFITRNKIFPVAVTDAWWTRVFQLLATLSDVVLLDISSAGKGLQWEIADLNARGLGARVLLIAAAERREAVGDFIQSNWSGNSAPSVHFIDDHGRMVDRAAFISRISCLLSHDSH